MHDLPGPPLSRHIVRQHQRFGQARATIDRAKAHDMDGYMFRLPLYAMAFLGGDSSGMAEQQQWLTSHTDSKHYALSLVSDTEAHGGKLTAARELTKRSAEAAITADSKENAAIWWENAALRDSRFWGYIARGAGCRRWTQIGSRQSGSGC